MTYEVGGASSPEDAFQRHARPRVGLRPERHAPGQHRVRRSRARPRRLHHLRLDGPPSPVQPGDEPVHAIWFVLGRRSAYDAGSPRVADGDHGPHHLCGRRDRRDGRSSRASTSDMSTGSFADAATALDDGDIERTGPPTVVVGRPTRAPSTPTCGRALAPGGWLARHVHAFEEALYVLEGELLLDLGRPRPPARRRRLRVHADSASATPWATPVDDAGRACCRSTPRKRRIPARAGGTRSSRPPARPRGDSRPRPSARRSATRPCARSATTTGTPPQLEALAVNDPARGRAPAGMDTAILAYSGISVKMLVDRVFGADLLTMFTVDYEPGGAAQAARPPVRGGVRLPRRRDRGRARRAARTRSGPGDVVFAGVGSVHGFYNTGSGRVRWIETQAPQPPARHAYRWSTSWERYGGADRAGGDTHEQDRSGRRRRRHAGDRAGDRPALRGCRARRSS